MSFDYMLAFESLGVSAIMYITYFSEYTLIKSDSVNVTKYFCLK